MVVQNIYKYDPLILEMNKRVCFAKGDQKRFIKYLKIKSKANWRSIAKILGINEGTLTKSYMFEYCDIPYNLFKKICATIKADEQDILKKYGGRIRREELAIGRKVFGEQKKILAPVNITYLKRDLNLEVSKISYSSSDLKKKIKIPDKITPELAEEMGMQFGDGFLSARKYEYRLKGNQNNEREYYSTYIKPLFKGLYNVDVNLKDFDRSFGFELCSKAIWEFKVKVLGIRPGKKEGISFPEILKIKDEKILGGFLRGLFDTDGCLSFKSRYGYKNYYPVIDLALTTKKVIRETAKILSMLGFNPRVYFNERYGKISINGIGAFIKYRKLIGWSSPKNLDKIKRWEKDYPELNKYGDCSSTVRVSGCGPEDEGSTPSFRPEIEVLK